MIVERCGHLHPDSLDDALLGGGYSALANVLDRQTPEDVLEEVKASGPPALRAGAAEWEVCRNVPATPRYFVANGEEGAPGLFTDRHLMEGDPQRVLEGLLIAAYAAGANRGIIHINGAARLPFERMVRARATARAAGLIGDRILGSAFSFHVEIRRGARGFVRGEERALLQSIEGQRASPGTRPPLPHESGLWERPTVISNVETLAALPPVIAAGCGGSARERQSATRLFGVSGPVNCPGIVEVPSGVTLRNLVLDLAAGLRDGRSLKGVRVAGPAVWGRDRPGGSTAPAGTAPPAAPRNPAPMTTANPVATPQPEPHPQPERHPLPELHPQPKRDQHRRGQRNCRWQRRNPAQHPRPKRRPKSESPGRCPRRGRSPPRVRSPRRGQKAGRRRPRGRRSPPPCLAAAAVAPHHPVLASLLLPQ